MLSSLDQIKDCTACLLYKTQAPALDIRRKSDVMWVGLSAKIISTSFEVPLDPRSRSGALLYEIEQTLPSLSFYSTNLVKCAPIDNISKKLRYPSATEIKACQKNLSIEESILAPQCTILLGSIVATSVLKTLNAPELYLSEEYEYTPIQVAHKKYLVVHHPSYIATYKRKDVNAYKQGIKTGILRAFTE